MYFWDFINNKEGASLTSFGNLISDNELIVNGAFVKKAAL